MPTYEYKCNKCHKNFEQVQKITEPPLKECPKCGGPVKRLISTTTFTLKGGGWYKDGYASTGSSPKGKGSTKKDK